MLRNFGELCISDKCLSNRSADTNYGVFAHKRTHLLTKNSKRDNGLQIQFMKAEHNQQPQDFVNNLKLAPFSCITTTYLMTTANKNQYSKGKDFL